MFISCSCISLYTSTILISAKPATQKANLDQNSRTLSQGHSHVSGSNDRNFHPELFRRGWRRRYFNPALSGSRNENGERARG